MRSIIDVLDLSAEELEELIRVAEDIMDNPAQYSEKCKGKQLATLFFEPSTRTRLSFESAMCSLGGSVLTVSDSGTSSVSKGESIADTIRTVSCFVDIAAMRHPKEGAALVAAETAGIPVINAGDGGHCHPTQTLADLLTIHREHGHFDGLTVGLCGDLKYGRTVHSLINALSRYRDVRFVLISPAELKLPDYMTDQVIKANGLEYLETTSLEDALPELDILYMTRIQRERFDDSDEYERLKDSYELNAEKMKLAKSSCSVLHPLPRVNEINVDVDGDPRACYFKQVKNGKFMRMALILKLLSDKKDETEAKEYFTDIRCTNPRCITSVERGIKHKFVKSPNDGAMYCAYCAGRYVDDEPENFVTYPSSR